MGELSGPTTLPPLHTPTGRMDNYRPKESGYALCFQQDVSLVLQWMEDFLLA